jgi:hypothetical protein
MRISVGAILIVSLFLAGCTYHISHDIEPVLQRRPLVESLPMTVGIYFSPEFRSYHGTQCGALFCNEYELGPRSVALFEIIAEGLFDKVAVVEFLSPSDSGLKVAGILAPSITSFDFGYQQITYRVTLYSPSAMEIGAWEVDGVASADEWLPGKRARLAMRDAAAKFVRGFRKEPVVNRWLEDAGVNVSVPTEPQNKEGVPP